MSDLTGDSTPRNVKFRVGYDWTYDCLALRAGVLDREGGWFQVIALPPAWHTHERGTLVSVEPTFRLDPDAAKSLMDALWQAGIRPTEVGTAGQLGATERHLADMRKIAFANLKLDERDT